MVSALVSGSIQVVAAGVELLLDLVREVEPGEHLRGGQPFVGIDGRIHLVADAGAHLELEFETLGQLKTRAGEHGLIGGDLAPVTDNCR